MYSHRYEVVYQRMQRHQVFSHTAESGYRLRQLEYLLASGGRMDSVVILGMISQIRENEWQAEDPTGVVRLDLREAVFHEGLFPEGSILLIEGYYDEKVLYVTGIGLPPCESSDATRRAFSVSNPFGGGLPGSLAAPQDPKMHRLLTTTQAGADAMIVFLGEVRLDRPNCLEKLGAMFSGYSSCPPVAFVLSGNFISPDSLDSNSERRLLLKRLLRQLLQLYTSYYSDANSTEEDADSTLNQSAQLILIPGPDDPISAPSHILPRPGLSLDLVQDNPVKPKWLHLVSNPCRIQLYTREIVLFRLDYSRYVIRHCMHLPRLKASSQPPPQQQQSTQAGDLMTECIPDTVDQDAIDTTTTDHVVSQLDETTTTTQSSSSSSNMPSCLGQSLARCLSSQAHLIPVLGQIAPVYWAYDQCLSLHPLPNLVVVIDPNALADLNASQPGLVETGNCRFINPGQFVSNRIGVEQNQASVVNYTFKVYYPKTGIVEDSCLPEM